MKYPKIMGLVLILAVALSACATSGTATTVPTEPVETLPPVETSTVEAVSSATPEVGTGSETPAVDLTGTAGVPVTGANCDTVTVQTASAATMSGSGSTGTTATSMPSTTATGTPVVAAEGTSTVKTGDFLVDCNGMTLYVTSDDTADSGASSCTGDCATQWPALTVSDGNEPMAGDGVDASLLGTLTRDDGTLQVTYNGWPLYLFSGDSLPGDQNGLAESGWSLISPAGEPIQ